MAKRRRRPGRPPTGHDPVLTMRLPAVVLGRIDAWAAELGTNRSVMARLLMEHAAGYGSYKTHVVRSLLVSSLQSKRRGSTEADRIASRVKEELRTQVAAYLAARQRPRVRRRAKRTRAIELTRAIEQK